MPIESLTFYSPWPNFGVALGRQWTQIREDTKQLAVLARAAFVDIDPTGGGDHDLSGWALGELGFLNRFRSFYDKVNDQFKIQVNTGTEAVPIWVDCLRIRQSDGRVIAAGTGGFQSLQGFYQLAQPLITFAESAGPIFVNKNRLDFLSDDFYLTGTSLGRPQLALNSPKLKQVVNFQNVTEFTAVHSFPDDNFTYSVYDNDKKSISPDAVFAYRTGVDFYLPRQASGRAILIW